MNIANKFVILPVALSNFAANAAIGTAALTVDLAGGASIPQTTAGIVLTLPAPTVSEIGQRFTIINTGTAAFVVGTTAIAPLKAQDFIWSGTAWRTVTTEVTSSGSVVATAGTNVIPTGTISAAATDFMNFTLPSAGIWEVSASVRGRILAVAGIKSLSFGLFTNANVLVANTETIIAYANQATLFETTAMLVFPVTVIASTLFKIRVWGTAPANTLAIGGDTDGRSSVNFFRIG